MASYSSQFQKKTHICKTHNTHTPTWAHPKTLYTYIYISTLTQCCLLTRPHTSAWYSHAHICTHMTSLTFLFTTHINFLHTYMFTFTWTCSPIYIASIDRNSHLRMLFLWAKKFYLLDERMRKMSQEFSVAFCHCCSSQRQWAIFSRKTKERVCGRGLDSWSGFL